MPWITPSWTLGPGRITLDPLAAELSPRRIFRVHRMEPGQKLPRLLGHLRGLGAALGGDVQTLRHPLAGILIGREAPDPRLGRHRGAGGGLHIRDLRYADGLRLGANRPSASP